MRATVTLDEDLDYRIFVKRVAEKMGVDLSCYKRKQMERRLRSLARQYGASTFQQFYARLAADSEALEQFRKRITINVSELFRNPEKFEELRADILPGLVSGTRRLKVWSAGCSYGAEAYSIAILAREMSLGKEAVSILGTDIDGEMLERAREGTFLETDMKNVLPLRRRRFFVSEGGGYRIRPEIHEMVEFRHHDLLRDEFERGFHLILCRNVVIYFTDEAKDRLYRKFFESLAPGGVVFIGSTERIFETEAIDFEHLGAFFYRKSVSGRVGVMSDG